VTGIEAIERIKNLLDYSIEAIIITGDTAQKEIEKIESIGLITLHKPIKPAQLRLLITKKMKSVIE